MKRIGLVMVLAIASAVVVQAQEIKITDHATLNQVYEASVESENFCRLTS